MDDHNERVSITVASRPNHGHETVADTLARLFEANRLPFERVDYEGTTTFDLDTSPSCQLLRAYPLPANPFSVEECRDPATGEYREPGRAAPADRLGLDDPEGRN